MAKDGVVAEQLKTESKEDYLKFRVFLALGANRSLDQAYKRYYDTEHPVPERWRVIAAKYLWDDRAQEYDKAVKDHTQPSTRR